MWPHSGMNYAMGKWESAVILPNKIQTCNDMSVKNMNEMALTLKRTSIKCNKYTPQSELFGCKGI